MKNIFKIKENIIRHAELDSASHSLQEIAGQARNDERMKRILFTTAILLLCVPSFAQEELTYEEYLLPVTVDGDEREPLKAMCEFIRHYDNPIYAKRKSWRQYKNEDKWGVEKYNEKLKIVDFSIVPNTECWHSPSYDLMKGNSIFARKIELPPFPFFIFNDSTNQFILLAGIKNPNGPVYREDIVITNNFVSVWRFHTWHYHSYKNGILLLHDEYKEQSVLFWDIHNEKDTILCKYEIKMEHPEFTHKNLIIKNTDWVFECEENVFVNGINIGKEKGYSKVFDYSYIDDKPFYFYEKDNLIYISYDDKSLPYKYKKVLHYLCCEPASLNPRSYNNMIYFYAQKEDENWYYVEIGVYE